MPPQRHVAITTATREEPSARLLTKSAEEGPFGPVPLASDPVDRLVPTPLAMAAAVVLAGVLMLAAVAKIRRPEATAQDFAGLGLPRPTVLALVVPAVEMGCAALLVVLPGWGGVATFGLLSLFTALLISVIRSGRVVTCACFGANDRDPISIRHVARNGALGLLALAAATIPDPIWRLELF